ncbi:MAG: hypothetical protein EOP48_12145 [Sphingobacteriales bacterium]|nr:MAG: hypothetical protein EOP48_12145 [Sphingobacteriales bacterium]
MEIFSYIMTIATSKTGVEVFLTIRNIVGTGRAEYGRNGDFGNVEMWIVPKSKKSKDELVEQLQALPFIQQVSVIKLSKPVTNKELAEVRELFNSLDWNTSDVKDEELTFFLNAKLQGKYTYMLDFEHGKRRTKDKVRIILAEEHPHFSPEWFTNSDLEEDILDRELTIDDFEIRSVVIENVVEVEPPPPPPPTADDQTQ